MRSFLSLIPALLLFFTQAFAGGGEVKRLEKAKRKFQQVLSWENFDQNEPGLTSKVWNERRERLVGIAAKSLETIQQHDKAESFEIAIHELVGGLESAHFSALRFQFATDVLERVLHLVPTTKMLFDVRVWLNKRVDEVAADIRAARQHGLDERGKLLVESGEAAIRLVQNSLYLRISARIIGNDSIRAKAYGEFRQMLENRESFRLSDSLSEWNLRREHLIEKAVAYLELLLGQGQKAELNSALFALLVNHERSVSSSTSINAQQLQFALHVFERFFYQIPHELLPRLMEKINENIEAEIRGLEISADLMERLKKNIAKGNQDFDFLAMLKRLELMDVLSRQMIVEAGRFNKRLKKHLKKYCADALTDPEFK